MLLRDAVTGSREALAIQVHPCVLNPFSLEFFRDPDRTNSAAWGYCWDLCLVVSKHEPGCMCNCLLTRAYWLCALCGYYCSLQGCLNCRWLFLQSTAGKLYAQLMLSQARLGEKETLDVTLRYFEDRKSRLDQLEYYQERRLKGLGLLDDDGNNTWDDFFKDSIA